MKVSNVIDCMGQNCPMPLIRTREAIMEAQNGDVIEIIGDHPQSFDEIPMALEAMNIKILKRQRDKDKWHIIFEV